METTNMTITNPIDLYIIKGATIGGKMMLFSLLEQNDKLSKDEIKKGLLIALAIAVCPNFVLCFAMFMIHGMLLTSVGTDLSTRLMSC